VTDWLLFLVGPYLAGVVAAAGLAWRGAVRRSGEPRPRPRGPRPGIWPRRIGLGGVLLLHLAGIVVPAELMAWSGSPVRLLALEGLGLAFAGLALVGCLLGLVFGLRRAYRAWRTGDALCATLLALVLVSGIVVTLVDRWGTSWYVLAVLPYLKSLVRFEPRLELAAAMPFLVRLHLLAAFVLVAVAPFYGLIRDRDDARPYPLRGAPRPDRNASRNPSRAT